MLIKRFSMLSTMLILFLLMVACERTDPESEVTSEPATSAGNDACLQGNWFMSNEDVNSLMTSLVPVPGLSIPNGTLLMAFTGEDFSYATDNLTVRIEMPGGYMEAEAAFLFTGAFSSSDGMLNISNIVYDSELLTWRANINGQINEAPGPNSISFPVPGSGPYGCSEDSLTIESTSGTGDSVVLFFTRQP